MKWTAVNFMELLFVSFIQNCIQFSSDTVIMICELNHYDP
jgi:hypothetical protein